MNEKLDKLVGELKETATEYSGENNKEESLFKISRLTNQIVILARKSLGFSDYEGRKDSTWREN